MDKEVMVTLRYCGKEIKYAESRVNVDKRNIGDVMAIPVQSKLPWMRIGEIPEELKREVDAFKNKEEKGRNVVTKYYIVRVV